MYLYEHDGLLLTGGGRELSKLRACIAPPNPTTASDGGATFPGGGVLGPTWRRHRLATARLRRATERPLSTLASSPGFSDGTPSGPNSKSTDRPFLFLGHDGPVAWDRQNRDVAGSGDGVVCASAHMLEVSCQHRMFRHKDSKKMLSIYSGPCFFYLYATHATQRNAERIFVIARQIGKRGNSRNLRNRRVFSMPTPPPRSALRDQVLTGPSPFQRVGVSREIPRGPVLKLQGRGINDSTKV